MMNLSFKMADERNFFFAFICLIFLNICAINCTGVPALVWSPTRSFVDLPAVYAGHTVKHADFDSKYLDPITQTGDELIIVFVQNKLGLEDFAHHADIYSTDGRGGAFHHVKSLVDENFSLQLPAVDVPAESIRRLKRKFAGRVVEVDAPYDVNEADAASARLMIVRLPDVLAADERKSFAHNDELIAKVLSGVGSRDYIAIYTAESPHQQQGDGDTLRYRGRHLLASPDNDTFIFINSTNCFLLYTHKIVMTTYNKSGDQVGEVNLTKPDVDDIRCVNMSQHELNMTFSPQDSNLTSVKIRMQFITRPVTGDWYISGATVQYDGILPGDTQEETGRQVKLALGRSYAGLSAIWAPLSMSYHCTDPPPLREATKNETTTDVTLVVSFDKLQLQPYFVHGNRFSVTYDCVPFFTGMIWTAIISVAILLLILFFGLSMISNIKVMRNFDDPKGKPLLTQTDD